MPRPYLAAVFALASCNAAPVASDDNSAVSYECGQTIVVGRIETLGETPICDDTGICWNSAKTAALHVKRALVGSRNGAVLDVQYGGHGTLRSDTDFLFVLEPNPNGRSFGLISASIVETRPRLVQPCTPSASYDSDEAA